MFGGAAVDLTLAGVAIAKDQVLVHTHSSRVVFCCAMWCLCDGGPSAVEIGHVDRNKFPTRMLTVLSRSPVHRDKGYKVCVCVCWAKVRGVVVGCYLVHHAEKTRLCGLYLSDIKLRNCF